MAKAKKKAEKPETVLVLRTCKSDMTSRGGFVWPESGSVECKDWDAKPECGNGLHGLLRGAGDGNLLDWSEDAKWLIVEVVAGSVVDIGGKVKFPRGTVVHCGTRATATEYLAAHGCQSHVVGATVTGGVGATVTGGDGATVTGGDGATVTGGYGATVTGGVRATVTGGDRATVTGGYGATVTGGVRATVTGGYGATVTGGAESALNLRWWDGNRYRIAVFYVGEDGIEAGVAYRCENGKPVKVEK